VSGWRDRVGAVWNRLTGVARPAQSYRWAMRSLAGTTITHENAFTLPAFYRGSALVSSAIAQLPWQVYRRKQDGGRERFATHAVEWLLQTAPNSEMTGFAWRETAVLHALTAGNHYSEIELNNAGGVANLWPLVPERVQPLRDDADRLFYRVWNPRGGYNDLPPSSIFHLHGMGWDGISGFDTVALAGESLGSAKAMEEYSAAFFGNGANVGLVVKLKNKPSPDGMDRMREEFNQIHAGPRNSHKVVFGEIGAEIERVGMSPEESQLLGARQHQIGESSRWLGARPHLLGDLSRATNNNIEHQSREFLLYDLMPWVLRIEQEANRKMFGQNRGNFYTKMNVNAFLRGDMQARAQFYKDLLLNGIATVNDIRELEDWDRIGPEGDVHMVQVQMTDLKNVGKQMPAATPVAPADPAPPKPNGAANGAGVSR